MTACCDLTLHRVPVPASIIMEADSGAVLQRVAVRTDDIPLGEQTVAQVSAATPPGASSAPAPAPPPGLSRLGAPGAEPLGR